MALVTLCPGCGTTFRVNAVQLQAHSGDVRCGHCQRIFNGFAMLITVNESAIEYPSQPQPQPQPVSKPETPVDPVESFAITADSSDAIDLPSPSDSNQEEIASSNDLFDAEEPSKQSWGTWGMANILLLLLLSGQITYTYRTELTIIAPGFRPYLERYCVLIACTVPYPQDIKQLGIETSDLQKNLVRQSEVTTLATVIRNHALFPQAWPALQLFLLDADDQPIASRIFTAQDYLHGENRTLQFIASQNEIEIRLDFDSSGLDASGYRLLLLYL
ncbi:MAG: zinc-ribbon domain-containing protein [Nitrosomonas sp.]|nr:zinc-ribbon domain-containing protein [Nitrosomonas sp.]